jgi:hypothetical protein
MANYHGVKVNLVILLFSSIMWLMIFSTYVNFYGAFGEKVNYGSAMFGAVWATIFGALIFITIWWGHKNE